MVSGKNEENWKNIFEFAKEMGIEIITSEPSPKDLDLGNRMAVGYHIQVALHNHPKHSKSNNYWRPELVLNALKGRWNLKICGNVGHWVRSGLEPVEWLKKMEGHIAGLHFKDPSEKSAQAHDVPIGQTPCNLRSANVYLKGNKTDKIHYSRFERGLDLDKVDFDFINSLGFVTFL